jgi:hypothetical protein
VLAYLILWVAINPHQIGQSDFTSTYMGATLFREGLGASVYDQALQTHSYARLIPDQGGFLPFDDAPLAAVVAAPVTLLGLDAAFRIWSLLQFALIAAAAVVAVRAASSEAALGRHQRVSVGLIALACMGTASTLFQGQWDGVAALGLAVFYACLRSRRMGTAGVVLAATSLLAKPQLALGLAAFALGWRDRRLILGALAGGVATVAVSLLAVGAGGVGGFLSGLSSQVNAGPLAAMISLMGIAVTVFGRTPTAHVVAAVGSLATMAVAALLGSTVRSRPQRLEAALAGATVLSLLASPHAYGDDLALLVPVAAWSLTALAARGGGVRSLRSSVIVIWVAISAAAYLVMIRALPALGNLTPWMLIAAAALAIAVCHRQGTAATADSSDPDQGLRAPTPAPMLSGGPSATSVRNSPIGTPGDASTA